MLVSLSLWAFLYRLQMDSDTYRNLLQGAAEELRDPSLKLYFKM